MRDLPDGKALLAEARNVLRNELLLLLPTDKQYKALMIANAMSIAERQLTNGEQLVNQELQSLQSLLNTEDSQLEQLNTRFAQQVRSGQLDDNPTAHQLLWQHTVNRVAESAPKALKPYGL